MCLMRSGVAGANESPAARSTGQHRSSTSSAVAEPTQPPRAPAKASPALRGAEGALSTSDAMGPTPSKFRRTDRAGNGDAGGQASSSKPDGSPPAAGTPSHFTPEISDGASQDVFRTVFGARFYKIVCGVLR